MITPTYSKNEELANTLSHGLGALLSITALVLLLTNAVTNSTVGYSIHNEIMRIVSFSIYGSSLLILFLSSTFYHATTNPQSKKVFKLLDHSICSPFKLLMASLFVDEFDQAVKLPQEEAIF